MMTNVSKLERKGNFTCEEGGEKRPIVVKGGERRQNWLWQKEWAGLGL